MIKTAEDDSALFDGKIYGFYFGGLKRVYCNYCCPCQIFKLIGNPFIGFVLRFCNVTSLILLYVLLFLFGYGYIAAIILGVNSVVYTGVSIYYKDFVYLSNIVIMSISNKKLYTLSVLMNLISDGALVALIYLFDSNINLNDNIFIKNIVMYTFIANGVSIIFSMYFVCGMHNKSEKLRKQDLSAFIRNEQDVAFVSYIYYTKGFNAEYTEWITSQSISKENWLHMMIKTDNMDLIIYLLNKIKENECINELKKALMMRNNFGLTPLDEAFFNDEFDPTHLISFLCETIINNEAQFWKELFIIKKENDGNTSLHFNFYLNFFEYFLKYINDVEYWKQSLMITNNEGQTPIQYTFAESEVIEPELDSILELLCNYINDTKYWKKLLIIKDKNGQTFFHYGWCQPKVFLNEIKDHQFWKQLLIIKDHQGNTFLHSKVFEKYYSKDNIGLIKLLLKSVNSDKYYLRQICQIKNKQNETPFDRWECTESIKFMKDYIKE